MPITDEAALHPYAKMLNTLNVECLKHPLAEDYTFETKNVFQALDSKQKFFVYIRPKLITIKRTIGRFFPGLGTVSAYGKFQTWVILAQNSNGNLLGRAMAEVDGDHLKRIDLCINPPPGTAKRRGEFLS